MQRAAASTLVCACLIGFVMLGPGPHAARAALAEEAVVALDVATRLVVPAVEGSGTARTGLAAARAVPGPAGGGGVTNSAGLASNMSAAAPLSAAVITALGQPFLEAALLGDWDGREDLVADHSAASSVQPDLNREYVELFGRSCAAPPAPVLPKLALALGQSNLHPGQVLALNASLMPGSSSGPVDAYVLLQVPTGAFFSLTPGGFVPGIVPAAAGIIPVPFSGTVLSAALPGGLPFGTYTWYSALLLAGSGFVVGDISDIARVPFDLLP